MISKPDSLIFDMDGTLWDAVDTYVASWNAGVKRENINRTFTRADLVQVMGWEREMVLSHLFPDEDEHARERIFSTINECRAEIIPKLGGVLYDGVREGLVKLSKEYQLFIVSNCPKGLINEFIKWSHLESYITDEMAHGVNSMPKHFNIKLLINKHGLKNPFYIGDTQGDSTESRLSGIPFVLLTYGFGTTGDFDLKFDDFNAFTEYFLNL